MQISKYMCALCPSMLYIPWKNSLPINGKAYPLGEKRGLECMINPSVTFAGPGHAASSRHWVALSLHISSSSSLDIPISKKWVEVTVLPTIELFSLRHLAPSLHSILIYRIPCVTLMEFKAENEFATPRRTSSRIISCSTFFGGPVTVFGDSINPQILPRGNTTPQYQKNTVTPCFLMSLVHIFLYLIVSLFVLHPRTVNNSFPFSVLTPFKYLQPFSYPSLSHCLAQPCVFSFYYLCL